MRAELDGHDKMQRKLSWVKRHLPDLKRYALKLMCRELADLLGRPGDLKYIEIRTTDRTFYGLSLEPPVELSTYASIGDRVMYYMPLDSEHPTYAMGVWAQQGNPWVPDKVPLDLGTEREQGFFWLRDAPRETMNAVRERNLAHLATRPRQVTPAERHRITKLGQVYVCDDLAYNQARAEFGIGGGASPRWRPALRQLIRDRIEVILQDVLEAAASNRIPPGDLPDFEPRPPSWLEEKSDFVLTITS
jgi:hypothetical protein